MLYKLSFVFNLFPIINLTILECKLGSVIAGIYCLVNNKSNHIGM